MIKKIAFFIAYRDFRDEEYIIPRNIFEENGIEVKTISSQKGIAVGSQGVDVEVDYTFSEFKSSNFDAVVFVGGQGALKDFDNQTCYKIIKSFFNSGKIVSAICIAPVILAKSGILKNKKATVWYSDLNKESLKILEKNGVIFKGDPVVIDENIITANGPKSAKEFGEKIIERLTFFS